MVWTYPMEASRGTHPLQDPKGWQLCKEPEEVVEKEIERVEYTQRIVLG
jgi:hypothetical protein